MEEELLGKESRWLRTWYRKSEDSEAVQQRLESKLSTGEASITFEEIAEKWDGWDTEERQEFLAGYLMRDAGNEKEDFRILEFLMDHTAPGESAMLPLMLMSHPDKKRIVRFLLKKINETRPESTGVETGASFPLYNFYVAAGWTGDPEAIPVLKNKISEMLNDPGLQERGDSPSEEAPGRRFVAFDCVGALAALCKLEPRKEHVELLGKFMRHPNVAVAQTAALCWRQVEKLAAPEGEE